MESWKVIKFLFRSSNVLLENIRLDCLRSANKLVNRVQLYAYYVLCINRAQKAIMHLS